MLYFLFGNLIRIRYINQRYFYRNFFPILCQFPPKTMRQLTRISSSYTPKLTNNLIDYRDFLSVKRR